MKTATSNIIIVKNILFTILFVCITYTHQGITQSTSQIRNNALQYIQYNPFQFLVKNAYEFAQYCLNFSYFRTQEVEIKQLSLQTSALIQSFEQIKTQNEELKSMMFLESNIQHQHTVKHIAKLHYSALNHNSYEVYFRSNDSNIPPDGLLINYECLIGRIFKKDGNLHHVLTTKDSRFRLPVYTKNTKVFGILRGDTSGTYFVPFDENSMKNIANMEEVLSASFNERFTENIFIGNIIKKNNRFSVKMNCKDYYNYALVL